MDKKDLALLEALQSDARASLAELGKRIGLSISATNERVKKLVATRMIRSWAVRLDAARLGHPLLAYAGITLDAAADEAPFLGAVMATPEIQECHPLTAPGTYMLKLRARDTDHLNRLVQEFLRGIPGVIDTQISIVRTTVKDGEYIPCLPADEAVELSSVG
jgi:Lrp/AsnC family leucine-responsive transcriptional regulator